MITRRKLIIPFIIAAIIIIYVIIPYINFPRFRPAASDDFIFIEIDLERSLSSFNAHSRPVFYADEATGGFFAASRDTIKFYDETGVMKNQAMYSAALENPVIRGTGGIVAVSERGGTHIYVYSNGGMVYTVPLRHPLISLSVNERGETCAIMQREEDYLIHVFTQTGSLIYENISSAKDIVPVLGTISPDGQLLAVVYYDYSRVSLSSIITFYALDRQETIAQNLPDAIIGSINDLEGEAVFAARFTERNRLLFISNKTVTCWETSPRMQKMWERTLYNELTGAYIFNDSFALLYGRPTDSERAERAGTAKIFSVAHMEERATIESASPPMYISGGKDALIIARSTGLTAYSTRDGRELWNYQTPVQTFHSYFVSNDKILVVHENRTALLQRQKKTE